MGIIFPVLTSCLLETAKFSKALWVMYLAGRYMTIFSLLRITVAVRLVRRVYLHVDGFFSSNLKVFFLYLFFQRKPRENDLFSSA